MKDTVEFIMDVLVIKYADYGSENRNYGELFDWLGDYDIITASDLGPDLIACNGVIYEFTPQDEGYLKREGFVELNPTGENVEDYLHENLEFVEWYKLK